MKTDIDIALTNILGSDVVKIINGNIYYTSNYVDYLYKEIDKKENIIKEVREKINKLKNETLIEDTGNTITEILYAKPCCRVRLNKIEEILDKGE